jgi:hypothetical protein
MAMAHDTVAAIGNFKSFHMATKESASAIDMAYRSFREVLAGLTPASIRRLQSIVVTQNPA